jgi:phosphatidylglycerol:prolipoprotein diacylglycerol transferase
MRPILFTTPWGFEVHTFGVLMVLAFLGAIYIVQIRAAKYGLTKAQVSDCCFWALVAGVFGARFAFIAQEPVWFYQHPSELFTLQFRGLTSFGGLIFGAVAVILWARKHGIGTLAILDLSAPAFVTGHAIGRIGCLMNGCCFGGVCPPTFPLGVHVEGSLVLHYPAQASDTLMNFGVLGLLLWREKKGGLRLGQLTGLMLILHGATRVIYEFFREGTQQQVDANIASSTYWGNLPFTQAQVMAVGLMAIGVALMLFAGSKSRNRTVAFPPEAHAV